MRKEVIAVYICKKRFHSVLIDKVFGLCIFTLTENTDYVEVIVYGGQSKFAGPSEG